MSISSSQHSSIKVLDEATVHRIAAGEVVDRPASVVKELVENSIDAKATKVRVMLVSGGLDLIEIEDNGVGMSHSDLALCLKRHATSKISNQDDLDHILSLGFRGEALAAVSSVAKISIETKARGDSDAWQLTYNDNENKIIPFTRKNGTKISISELFYNTPARRKFLKSAGSEASACSQALWNLALSNPSIEFEWHIVDAKGELKEQEKLPSQSPRERFLFSLGNDAELVEVFSKKPVPEVDRISMIAARAPVSYRTQKNIHLFVNGRYVQDKRLSYALREAYTGLIEVGCFPAVWIDAHVDPSLVDVNIHPQKKELRWPKGFSLASVAYRVLRPHLDLKTMPTDSGFVNMPTQSGLLKNIGSNVFQEALANRRQASQDSIFDRDSNFSNLQKEEESQDDASYEREELMWPIEGRRAVAVPERRNISAPPFKFAELNIVGEAGASWLVLESKHGLVLVDQHAAHERINYERILEEQDLLRPKPLLLPIKIKLPMAVSDYRDELVEVLETFAFECSDIDHLKDDEIEFIALPESDRKIKWEELLEDLFERVEDSLSLDALRLQIESKIAASLACHGSIRRGQRLKHEQIKALMHDLDAVDWGAFCPHGRPVWILMSHQQIEDMFHR
ncbi:DNA mismatch repair endonuclease MutL [bacterium]|nr:DNA mismatch repair endonuclease MutL [bacterium]